MGPNASIWVQFYLVPYIIIGPVILTERIRSHVIKGLSPQMLERIIIKCERNLLCP